MSDDLIVWLRAALDEDEQVARATLADNVHGSWRTVPAESDIGLHEAVVDNYAGVRLATGPADINEHIARHDPARVLAEVAAKRRIIDLHGRDHECSIYDHGEISSCNYILDGDCSTMRLLALPYAGRPGYREEWRP